MKNDNRSQGWNVERKTADGRTAVTRNSTNIFYVLVCFRVFFNGTVYVHFYIFMHAILNHSSLLQSRQVMWIIFYILNYLGIFSVRQDFGLDSTCLQNISCLYFLKCIKGKYISKIIPNYNQVFINKSRSMIMKNIMENLNRRLHRQPAA